ncbi:MAG TPA: hydroxymyristoyl-ACP dehydratase [Burkholderiales bacterium]|nr:hydroxymyristoyl-ACP dehydratase [Burkholderiales bacterium]
MSESSRMNAVIGASRIRDLIPHAGAMCLLERVIEYDDASICCEARSHLDVDNPLRHNGRLSTLCGIEYAGQAMALHGALRAGALKPDARHTATASPGTDRPSPQSAAIIDSDRTPGLVRARHGFLASVRDARISRRYMDDVSCPLTVSAVLEFDDALRVIYAFTVAAGDIGLIQGRAAVVLG